MVRSLILLAFFFTFVSLAQAETHVSIDARSQIVFDATGKVEAIRQIWLFDAQYSAFAVEGMSKSGRQVSNEALLSLAKINIESIKDSDYFTHLIIDGQKVQTLDANEFSLQQEADKRIVLRFTLPLKLPLSAQNTTLKTYDNSGFSEINYVDNGIELINAPSLCQTRLRIPKTEGSAEQNPPEALAATIVIACNTDGVSKLRAEDEKLKLAASPAASSGDSGSKSTNPSQGPVDPTLAEAGATPPSDSAKEHPRPDAEMSKCSEDTTIETVKSLEGANSPVLKIYEKMGAKIESSIEAIRTITSSSRGALCEARLTIRFINLNEEEKLAASGNDELSDAMKKLKEASNQKVTEIAYKVEVTDDGQDHITILPNGIDPAQQFQQTR